MIMKMSMDNKFNTLSHWREVLTIMDLIIPTPPKSGSNLCATLEKSEFSYNLMYPT
jgi:hypothetical protein